MIGCACILRLALRVGVDPHPINYLTLANQAVNAPPTTDQGKGFKFGSLG